ncbi:LysR family transcriptional regulator [Mesorhizobium sp. M7D.F.Ca.US.005.01.1.1]|uniref:DNA-binding transcriptional LysR family regulator n=1 Tax=Rhizobium loti TaxID=381 RepID=A0A8E2W7M3_RHILI|nr:MULTISPECIES: LysR family transcriptional regulator [Mesorhizobium]AZO41415.1 LysR family transcriptional regulator [Mesorhizobium sp. M7D.F.Ca.US.005.01.1.1]PWJ88027.1 DNA-binding transcriptional LysR family regulator [Mesorhizobium loti]
MDAEALNTFLTVYRQRGFSNAARVLNRTQPAISHRISLLEQELGIPLFERMSTGIALSQAGRVLLPYAERALAALQDAETAVLALKTENAGPLSLAAVGTLASTSLTGILKRFAASHPSVDLALQTVRSTEVSDLVRRGEATIGIRYDRDRSPDLQYDCLGAEKLLVVCSTDHASAGSSIKSLAGLVDERWIAFPEIPGQREIWASHVFSIFQTLGLGEVDWTPVDSLTAQKRLVEAGFGLALMTESGVAEERAAGTLATIDVRDLTLTIPIFIVTRRGGFLSAAASRLHELLSTDYLGRDL